VLIQAEVEAILDTFSSWDDDKKAKYENVQRQSYLSSTGFQEMNLKLPVIGVLVYCISLIAFTVDFLSEVTGWKLLSALPWVLHEIFTLMTLVGLCVGMYFIARSYRLAANNTRYLAKQLDAARSAFQSGIDGYFEQWGLSEAEKDIALLTIKGMTISEIAEIRQTKQSTIKTQSSAIYKKAGVSSPAQLVSSLIEELLK
jgi:DNA-binding CsgD family transcriptional regulator